MSAGEQASTGQDKRGKGKLFGASEPSSADDAASQKLETLSEYMRAQPAQEEAAGQVPTGERLPQEWDLDADTREVPAEEDILQRLERIEKRLDAFENTSYTFLLYAKQLTDRTVSFFEDIF